MPDQYPTPDVLLHIGYIKAGSSWLQKWLDRRPDIALTMGGLGGYRTVHDLINDAAGGQPSPRYLAISEERLTGGLETPNGYFRLLLERRGHDATELPIKINQARIARLLHSLYPHARVLIITRGFAGALRSTYSQVIRLGGGFHFGEYLEQYRAYIREWLDYDYVLGLYRDLYGPENVICLPFELLQQDEADFAATLERLLGLDHLEISLGRVYPSLSLEEMYWYAALARRLIAPVTRRLSERAAIRVYKLYAGKFIDQPLTRLLIRIWTAVARRQAAMEIPAGYLDQFSAHASRLAELAAYAPFRGAYLMPDGTRSDENPHLIQNSEI